MAARHCPDTHVRAVKSECRKLQFSKMNQTVTTFSRERRHFLVSSFQNTPRPLTLLVAPFRRSPPHSRAPPPALPPSPSSAAPMSAAEEPSIQGQCHCGKVKFTAVGKIRFNNLCHCRNCSRARSSTPVHIVGVTTAGMTFTQGEKLVKVGENRPLG
jgi:hypothetical protein